MAQGLYYEDFRESREHLTDFRTVTVADIEAFADVSGDRNPLHLDDDYARASIFGGRVAHGLLGLAIASGLLNRSGLTRGTLLAFLGLSWDFRVPLRPGDRVGLRTRVSRLRGTARGDRGIVLLEAKLVTPEDEVLQEGELKLLVRRRPGAGADLAAGRQSSVPPPGG